jgi:protein-disulfide isomerase
VRVGPTLKQIVDTYGDKVRVIYRDYPLPMHPRAQPTSEAARCAGEQGKFWEFHDKIFASPQALEDANFKQHAADLGLDLGAFNACYDAGKFRAAIQAEMQAASALGVSGTPAFFINGRFVSGALPFEQFQSIIDEELQRAGA